MMSAHAKIVWLYNLGTGKIDFVCGIKDTSMKGQKFVLLAIGLANLATIFRAARAVTKIWNFLLIHNCASA